MLLLSRSEIERLLDLDALRDAVARAMVELSAGTASMPQRIAAVVPARDALLVVESRAGTLAPPPAGSNDIAMAIAEGTIGRDHVHAELGELVSGARPGRTEERQITLYKSVGVAVQDAAAAALVLTAARRDRVGREVDI